MSAMLIRGLTAQDRRKIQKMAEMHNKSMNQWFVDLVRAEFHKAETQEKKEAERKEAFRRIRVLAAEIAAKYGKQEDSTKIIREFRDKGRSWMH